MTKIIKTIISGDEARVKMLKGMNTLADAVGSTLGPRSRNVAVDKTIGQDVTPTVLHDGVSVARSINVKDVHEDMGVRLLKDASLKTNETAGDGTTTSTIIAQALVQQAFVRVAAGDNPMAIRESLEKDTKQAFETLKSLAKPVKTDTETAQIASISAADSTIGTMVAEAVKKVGDNGAITIEDGSGYETTVEYKEGMEIDRGYYSSYFVTNEDSVEAVINNPYILLTDKRINHDYELLPFLDVFVKNAQSKNIVIFAGEVLNTGLQLLVVNKMRGKLNTCAIQSPAFGGRRVDELSDIAVFTGGSAILEETGRSLDSVKVEELGRADKIIVDRDKTIILGGKGDVKQIEKRQSDLTAQIKIANTGFDRDIKQERLAKLSGSVAVIHVGGATEVEIREKRERIIDAKNATKAALEEGIVAGGEITLLEIAKSLPQGILKIALEAPFRRLIANSGYDYGSVREKMAGKEYPHGIDVLDGKVKDLVKSGIIDPVRVTRVALQNAVSIASMALTTETLVTDYVKND